MLVQLMYRLGLFKRFERMKSWFIWKFVVNTWKKKMSSICDFDRIWKTECYFQHFTRNCRIKNLDDFECDEADAYLWRAWRLNVKGKEMIICYIINRCLVMFLRGGKVNVVWYWWSIVAKLKVNKPSLSKWLSN